MTAPPIQRVLVFGDSWGVSQVVDALPSPVLCGLVAAEIRPQYLPELERLAARLAAPLVVQVKPASADYDAFLERVRTLAPELIFVCSYAMLLREELLAIPSAGAVNVHGGLLPQYRGCNPIQWALLNNETETGVTMHYMTAEFDAGDIIAQRRVPIELDDTWREIQQRLAAATGALLSEQIPRLLQRCNARHPQEGRAARHYRRRKPEDGEIDWRHRVIDIYNLVRALVKPHPGAFCLVGGKRRVFDEYLTLQEVTGLKFGPVGGQSLESDGLRLEPVTSGDVVPRSSSIGRKGSRDQAVALRATRLAGGDAVGTVVMERFDYRDGICELTLHAEGGGAAETAEAARLALEYAARELGLDRVSVRIESAGLATADVLQAIGEPWKALTQAEESVVLQSRG